MTRYVTIFLFMIKIEMSLLIRNLITIEVFNVMNVYIDRDDYLTTNNIYSCYMCS